MNSKKELAIYTWSAVDNTVRKESVSSLRVFVMTHKTDAVYNVGENEVYTYRKVLSGAVGLATLASSVEQAHDRFKLNAAYAALTFGEAA